MNHQDLYKLLTTVQKNVRCPQCGKQYSFSSIQIRGIVDSIIFLEMVCTSHMPLLATVTLAKKNTSAPAMKNPNGVTPDDVIEVYRLLKNYNGSFEKLFNNKGK